MVVGRVNKVIGIKEMTGGEKEEGITHSQSAV